MSFSCTQCPHCGKVIFLARHTVGVVCPGCRHYIREHEFRAPDPERLPKRTVNLFIPRDDRNMKIWRQKREKLERTCDKRQAKAARRG